MEIPRQHPVRILRLARGLTLLEVASQLGTTKATMSRIENFHQVPGDALKMRIFEWSDGMINANKLIEVAQDANGTEG